MKNGLTKDFQVRKKQDKKLRLFGWGDNKFGQLGFKPDGQKSFGGPCEINVPLTPFCEIYKIFCGWTHGTLLTSTLPIFQKKKFYIHNYSVLAEIGRVFTWGRNNYGQLGEKRIQPWEPLPVTPGYLFEDLAVGSQHTIGLTEGNKVVSWGWNEHGSCGDGTLIDRFSPVPVQLPEGFEPKFIATGAAHSFVYGEIN